jgi:hypothetical protein
LANFQQRQQDDLTIGEFQRVVMGRQFFLVDLTEDRSPVLKRAFAPRPHAFTPDVIGKRQLCGRWDTNGHTRIFRRTEASRAGLEEMRSYLVTDLSWPGFDVVKAVVTHWGTP